MTTKTELAVEQVRPEMIGVVAPHILDLVEKACAYSGGRYDATTVFEACAGLNQTYTWYLWVVYDKSAVGDDPSKFAENVRAVVVTSLNVYPTGLKMVETILIGGRGPSEEWLPYFDELKLWAKANSADRIQYIGRKGWQRSMKSLGIDWKPVATMFECVLENENEQR